MDTQAIDWPKHMREYQTSGMSIKDYCSANGLSFREFKNSRYRYNYNRQTKQRTATVVTSPSFKAFNVGVCELKLRIDPNNQVSLHGIELTHLPAIVSAIGALSK